MNTFPITNIIKEIAEIGVEPVQERSFQVIGFLAISTFAGLALALRHAYAQIKIKIETEIEIDKKIRKEKKEQFLKSNAVKEFHNKNIVLVLETENDYNGAFSYLPIETEQENYSVAIERVKDINSCNKAIKEAIANGNTIIKLALCAHGSENHITLGKLDKIQEDALEATSNKLIKIYDKTTKTYNKLAELHISLRGLKNNSSTYIEMKKKIKNRNRSIKKLAVIERKCKQEIDRIKTLPIICESNLSELQLDKLPEATNIVLHSCKTGKYIARQIAGYAADGRIVTAPKENARRIFNVMNSETLQVAFYDVRGSHLPVIGKIISMSNTFLFLLSGKKIEESMFLYDMTVSYRLRKEAMPA
jgi:hypothetical protein